MLSIQLWAGLIAPCQAGIGGIDNGIAGECCNVPLPKIQTGFSCCQGRKLCDSLFPYFLLQIFILHLEETLADICRHPDIEQAVQQLPLFCLFGWNIRIPVFRMLVQQIPNQIPSFFFLIHEIS